MAVIQKRGDSYRVLIRKKGHAAVSKTFKTKALAERWARDTEYKIDEGKFAVDKATGKQVGAVEIPSRTSAVPMTFMHKGKQYIVFATGAGSNTSLVALRLPAAQ